MKNLAFWVILCVLVICGAVYWMFEIKEARAYAQPDDIEIVKTWDLPRDLVELSGIAYISSNRVACVQDEAGIIYIFNLKTETVEKEIQFANDGDYEGITLVNNTAYVLRSDGTLFEVRDFMNNPAPENTIEHTTFRKNEPDVEGVCFDKKNNRLLLIVKENEGKSTDYKGIFAFDLNTKQFSSKPLHNIDLSLKIFENDPEIRPTDIAINPANGKLYFLDASDPKLIQLNTNGTPQNSYRLNLERFPQAEGLTFGPNGEIYIGNENRPGNILQITLDPKTSPAQE